jgi:hypothetical protein
MSNEHDVAAVSQIIKKTLEENIKPLEKRLNVTLGFFKDLLKEKNDWSFIIKIHSLVEAAVSYYLSLKIGNNKLENVFQKLPLSTASGGKIDFLRALGLLKEHRGFIVLLSRLRNEYVHIVSNVSLRFEDYFVSHEDNFNTLVKEFRKIFSQYSKPQASNIIKKTPRYAIWILTMILLMDAYEGIPREAVPIEMLLDSIKVHR